jgi:hypothetical protein
MLIKNLKEKSRRGEIMRLKIFILLISLCLIGLNFFERVSFAFEKPLLVKGADLAEVKGNFNLILYGGRHSDDLETLAILDIDGDNYFFDPFAPDFDYKVFKNVPAEKAIQTAEKFVSFHNAFHKTVLKKILDSKGKTIGYELRPLYYPIVYGFADVMDVFYWEKEGGRIKVLIRLIEPIELLKFPGGAGDAGGSGGN